MHAGHKQARRSVRSTIMSLMTTSLSIFLAAFCSLQLVAAQVYTGLEYIPNIFSDGL